MVGPTPHYRWGTSASSGPKGRSRQGWDLEGDEGAPWHGLNLGIRDQQVCWPRSHDGVCLGGPPGPAYLRGLVGHHDALPAGDGVVHILRKAVALHADEVTGGGRLSCGRDAASARAASRGQVCHARGITRPSPWAWHMGLRLAALVPSGRLAQQPCCALLRAPAPEDPGAAGRKWGEELGPHCQPLPPAPAVSQTARHRGWGGPHLR